MLGRWQVRSLFYKYSTPLMEAAPGPTVMLWMRKPQLEAAKLVPALVKVAQSCPRAPAALPALPPGT